MRQSLGLGVIDHVNVTAVVPLDVNSKARVKPAELGHADGVSGGVVAAEGELVAVHFADPLRCKVANWILWPGYAPDDAPQYIIDLVKLCYAEAKNMDVHEYVSAKPYSDSLRKLLQFVGTEYYRAKDRAYWIKSMHLDPDLHYVITDRRF